MTLFFCYDADGDLLDVELNESDARWATPADGTIEAHTIDLLQPERTFTP